MHQWASASDYWYGKSVFCQHDFFPNNNYWKVALVIPLLKKLTVSNLSLTSKCTEKLVIQQLLAYCSENAPLPNNQSAYRKFHSSETCLLKVQNDILLSMDQREVPLLVLLNLSAAFNTIVHNILITESLKSDFGVTDNALQRVNSLLSWRHQRVLMNQTCFKDYLIRYIPQGSCLGQILFLLYISQLFKLMESQIYKAVQMIRSYICLFDLHCLWRMIMWFVPWVLLLLMFVLGLFCINSNLMTAKLILLLALVNGYPKLTFLLLKLAHLILFP